MSENLSRLIEESKRRVAAMTPAEYHAMMQEQVESWVRGEMGMGSDADEAAAREAWRKEHKKDV